MVSGFHCWCKFLHGKVLVTVWELSSDVISHHLQLCFSSIPFSLVGFSQHLYFFLVITDKDCTLISFYRPFLRKNKCGARNCSMRLGLFVVSTLLCTVSQMKRGRERQTWQLKMSFDRMMPCFSYRDCLTLACIPSVYVFVLFLPNLLDAARI